MDRDKTKAQKNLSQRLNQSFSNCDNSVKFGKIVGQGGFATVLYGKQGNKAVAYKTPRLDSPNVTSDFAYLTAQHEANVHNDIANYKGDNHRHVMSSYGTIRNGEELAIAFPRIKMSMEDYQKTHKNDVVQKTKLLEQIANGLSYIHERDYLHKDIKQENIFLVKSKDKNSPKLKQRFTMGKRYDAVVGDLGMCTKEGKKHPIETQTHKDMFYGSIEYTAPEVMNGFKSTKKSDVYSFGCTMVEMLYGIKAKQRKGNNKYEIIRNYASGNTVVPTHKESNPTYFALNNIAKRCLDVKPSNRYQNMGEVYQAIKNVSLGEHILSRAT